MLHVEIVNTDDTLPGGLGHSSSSTTRRRSLKLAETVGICWDLLGKQLLVGGLGWWFTRRLAHSQVTIDFHRGTPGLQSPLSKNFPTYPWNIPQTPNQQFMKEFLSFGGLGKPGVCSRGMLGFP